MLNFVRRCITTLIGKDDRDIRVQQVGYNGKAEDAEIYAPYGMSYNLPADCLCLYVQIGGDQGNLVVLPDRSQDRVRDLKAGEVAFFNPLTKSRTIYRENGDMEIVTDGEKGDRSTTIKGDDVATVGGKVTVTVSGDVDLTAANVNIDAATTNLGIGGPAIARVGDPIQVTVAGGSSAGTHSGTITGGGANTSI